MQVAGRLPRTSWDKTRQLMQRAVARELKLKELVTPTHLGVDEMAAGRAQNYVALVNDLDRGSAWCTSPMRSRGPTGRLL